MPFFRGLRSLLILIVGIQLSGCYYVQAARGQLEVMNKREPIEEVIASPETPEDVAEKLELLRDARQFAVDELGLPDNESYRTYSDLGRDYAVWNVVAAPALSVDPRTWCFPVVGCVAYRGYFKKEKADRKAAELADKQYDTFVGGATAYSTLGRFSDPVLSTMMKRGDTELVALLFHELSHQVLYIRDDTAFNESFATAVEELGVERWLARDDRCDDYETWIDYKNYADDVTTLALAARDELEALYAEDLSDAAKLAAKNETLRELEDAIGRRAEAAGIDPTGWWQEQPLNNARLAAWSAYETYVPAFRRLFASCNEDFTCFYKAAAELGDLEPATRRERLEALGADSHKPRAPTCRRGS